MMYLVVPAYNEEKDLPKWLSSLVEWRGKKYLKKLIIVDDGSTDKTSPVVKSFADKLPIKLIRYKPNGGPGTAFRQGLRVAIKLAGPDDLIVTMECDNTSDLKVLDKMAMKIRGGTDVCVASYYTIGGGFADVSRWRILVSHIGNWLIRNGCGIRDIHTYSSFYRVYRAGILKQLAKDTHDRLFIENGFACVVEILARLKNIGAKLSEVPMILVGSNRRGKSKMRQVPTALGYFRVLLYHRLHL